MPLPADKTAQLQGATTLRARLVPDRLRDLLALQQMDRDWLATVYDREGRVVARTQGAERYFGVEAPRDLLLKLRGQWEGLTDTTSLDGVAVQTAFVRTETSGWAVAISVPSASLRLPLTRALAWVVGGFLLTIAGSLLLAWRIGGRIAGAVQALTQPALALGTGVAVEVPPLGVVEVDRVGRALTHAARLLDAAQHEANHDALTGLANRSLFRQMVQQQLALARRNGTSLAVLYVDLDGFKEVNDTHGHGVGDLLLKEAAQRLRAAVRAGDLVARLGGDEFAIALVHPGQRGAAKVAAKLVQWLSEPFELGGLRVSVSASIGGAVVSGRRAGRLRGSAGTGRRGHVPGQAVGEVEVCAGGGVGELERRNDAVKRANVQCEPRWAIWFSWRLMHSLIGDARFDRSTKPLVSASSMSCEHSLALRKQGMLKTRSV